MFTMRFWLRMMLGSLAAAALLGVVAVIMGNSAIFWRIGSTGVGLGLTSAAMLPLMRMMDRRQSRNVGLFAMGVVLSVFLFSLLGIWWPDWLYGRSSWHWWGIRESFWVSAIIVFGMGLPATALLAMTQHRNLRWAGRTGLAIAAAGTLLFMLANWLPFIINLGSGAYCRMTTWKLCATAWALVLLGMPLVIALVGAGVPESRRPWRWIGVAASAVAMGIAWYATWWEIRESSAVFICIVSLAAFVALANMLVSLPLKPGQTWLRWGTLVSAAACTLLVDIHALDGVLWVFSFDAEFTVERLIAATAILAGCGTLGMLVLVRMNRTVDWEPTVGDPMAEISLQCPRCHRKHTLPLGDTACPTCRLRISVHVEEPRCRRCGYLLHMLTSTACPECGEPIETPAAATVPVESTPPLAAS